MRKVLLLFFIVATLFHLTAPAADAEEISRPITAWPLLHHKVEQDQAETDALFSFYHFERKETWSKYSIGYFLFLTEGDPARQYRKTSVLWPISRFEHEGERASSYVFPLYWHKRNPEISYSVLFPFYWAGEGKGYSYTHLWPLYSRQQQGSYREYGTLYPLIRYGRDPVQDITLGQFLLYYHKRERANSFTTLFPLYGRKVEGPERRTWLIPLYYSQRDADSLLTLAPLYYHHREPGSDSLHLWPLFSRQEQGTYREYGTLYPLIRYGRDPVQDITLDQFLLYYHKRERANSFTTLFPLYGRKVEGPERRTWFIPLYYSRGDADSLLTLAPLYYHRREPGSDSLHLWPLFSRQEQGTYREYGTLYPLIRFGRDPVQDVELDQFLLYYHKRERTASFSTFFPMWWHQEKDEHRLRDLTLLLHWYERDETRDETDLAFLWLVPPKISLFQYNRKGSVEQHRLFPLYSYSFDRERDAMSWSVLWFLFSYSSEGEFEQQTGFLWKVISYERKDAETSDFRFLWRFIRRSSTATSSIFEFNPFYYYEAEVDRGTYWAILGGLIGVETTPENKKKFRLFWLF